VNGNTVIINLYDVFTRWSGPSFSAELPVFIGLECSTTWAHRENYQFSRSQICSRQY